MSKHWLSCLSINSSILQLKPLTALLLLTIALSMPGYGQVLYGSLTGTVSDPSGAAISGAKIQATEVRTGVSQQATSDASGIFTAS